MISPIDKHLEVLHKEIIEMGGMCEEAILLASQVLSETDEAKAKKVFEIEKAINEKERIIEDVCLKGLLRQQPVAKDLRKISAALKMITDMERIGDQARDIAEICMIHNLKDTTEKLITMAELTIKIVTDSIDSYVENDLTNCHKVIEYDKFVDDIFEQIQKDIVDFVSEDNTRVLEGMYVLMVAKYFERIGDHATNISEWVEFSITGKHEGDE